VTVTTVSARARRRAGIVARRPLVRDALAYLLRDSGIDVVAEVASFAALDEADADGKADIAVLSMPDDSGIAVIPLPSGCRWSDGELLDRPVVVIDWDARPEDLLRLVRSPASCPYPLPPDMPTCGEVQRAGSARLGLSELTDREINILALLSDGQSATEASHALGISPHTGRTHIANILRKLGVHSRLEAVSSTRDLLHTELEARDVAV
jgi:DNA-binding NarL/FixJ family response regulator